MKVMQKALAEAIGTFALVFAGCGSIMIVERFPGALHPISIPIIFGVVVMVMVYAVGHISGAHFNPAVTLGFAIARHFPGKHVVIYWSAQLLGAFFAISLLHFILPPGLNYGATLPHVSPLHAFIWEAILTFFLMFVIVAVATDTRAVGMMAGTAIGATVLLGAFLGGPVTGGSMNPIRSIVPALFEENLNYLWIYILGPFVGAAIASLLYKKIQ